MCRKLIIYNVLSLFLMLNLTPAIADDYEQQLKQEAAATKMQGEKGIPTTETEPAVTLPPEVDEEALAAEISFELEQALRQTPVSEPAPVSAEPALVVDSVDESAKIRTHIVKSDESLSLIAQQYYKDRLKYWKIYQANQALLSNPDLILSGQRLVIPE